MDDDTPKQYGSIDLYHSRSCFKDLISEAINNGTCTAHEKECLEEILTGKKLTYYFRQIGDDQGNSFVQADDSDEQIPAYKYWHDKYNKAQSELSDIKTYQHDEIDRLLKLNKELIAKVKELEAGKQQQDEIAYEIIKDKPKKGKKK